MIRIKPAWKSENAADIQSLYGFLLYRTLPFEPSSFLPKDEIGFYYYENGDRHTPRKYPTAPYIKWKLRKSSHVFLNTYEKAVSQYCQANPAIFQGSRPQNTNELIYLVSKSLYNMLNGPGAGGLRSGLQKLLAIVPNQETVASMNLSLNLDFLELAEKLYGSSEDIASGLRKLLYAEVFNYDKFSQNDLFPKLIQLLGIDVCPYCNRAFTSTARRKDGTYHRQNQVDHYAPKSLYPWFALSLANFIPACGNCNQKKGDKDGFVLYPYEESFEDMYYFRSVPVSGFGYLIGQPTAKDEFQITIEKSTDNMDQKNSEYHRRVQNSIERFGLDVLYRESHNAYVAGMYAQRYVFGDAYIDSLVKSFPQLFSTRDDVRRLLYLKQFDSDSLDKVPLSKLTHDIDAEITRLSKCSNSGNTLE